MDFEEEHSYGVKPSYGSAGASKRVHLDSVFRIASISKPITAFVILHLCLDYNVCLDSKVFGKKGILKSYKYRDKRVSAITIRHLLQHSAGWDRDVAGDLAFVRPSTVVRCDPESVEHNHALLSYTLTKRLQFKPGTRHAYSNLGYLVLGLVIEEISGGSYASYLSRVLKNWNITGIDVGGPWRADWTSMEVEYFNNREPVLAPSLHTDLGVLLPQYGGLAMHSAAAYGGLVSNAVSLLQFMNVIETLACKEKDDRADGSGDYLSGIGVVSDLVKESLRRPDYESSLDWYGLGWDVQDKGRSWGHTGGMEGTSCVLFHHMSGLSWVLLLNAWARDVDLNGVMKCAISHAPSLNLFDCDIRLVRELDGVMESNIGIKGFNSGRVIYSKEKSQVIVLGVDEMTANAVVLSLKVKDYIITWISAFQNELDFPFDDNAQFSNKSGLKNGWNSSSLKKLSFALLFSLHREQYVDYILMLNKSNDDLSALYREKRNMGYIITFVDSFCDFNGNIRYSAVLIKYDSEKNAECERSLHLAVKASSYVRHIKSWVKSQVILCQAVTEVMGELFVTALLESKTKDNADSTVSSYWVQIEPESFLTELNRKIKQNMGLMYAKFYNADGQAWVSGCWTNGQSVNVYHRISMSKYGLFPELADAAAEDIRLLSVSEYEDDSVVYYAGLWMAN